jgi:hypothetical protein
MEALKPPEVRRAQERQGVKRADRGRRKTEAYVRQGEWFFVPVPNLKVEESFILRREPISRGNGSKPHIVEFCYRDGGESVYVCTHFPRGLPEAEYRKVLQARPESSRWRWQVMRRNPQVYVKGRVSHPDHKTIVLPCWHRVRMNTEHESLAMRSVAFLD